MPETSVSPICARREQPIRVRFARFVVGLERVTFPVRWRSCWTIWPARASRSPLPSVAPNQHAMEGRWHVGSSSLCSTRVPTSWASCFCCSCASVCTFRIGYSPSVPGVHRSGSAAGVDAPCEKPPHLPRDSDGYQCLEGKSSLRSLTLFRAVSFADNLVWVDDSWNT